MEVFRAKTIQTHVCGPFKEGTFGGKEIRVIFTVTSHRYTSNKLIKSRDEVLINCRKLISWVEQHTNLKIKRVHRENAREYLGMPEDLEDMGIVLTTSTPYIPQSNGLSEKMNCKLIDKVRVMLQDESGLCSRHIGRKSSIRRPPFIIARFIVQ